MCWCSQPVVSTPAEERLNMCSLPVQSDIGMYSCHLKKEPATHGYRSVTGIYLRNHQIKTKLINTSWYIPIIPALGRLRQEDGKLRASLYNIERDCLKKTNKAGQ